MTTCLRQKGLTIPATPLVYSVSDLSNLNYLNAISLPYLNIHALFILSKEQNYAGANSSHLLTGGGSLLHTTQYSSVSQ